jgi:hypothetical protein
VPQHTNCCSTRTGGGGGRAGAREGHAAARAHGPRRGGASGGGRRGRRAGHGGLDGGAAAAGAQGHAQLHLHVQVRPLRLCLCLCLCPSLSFSTSLSSCQGLPCSPVRGPAPTASRSLLAAPASPLPPAPPPPPPPPPPRSYEPSIGFRVSVDMLLGLPKSKGLYKAMFSLSPPGAPYQQPKLTDEVRDPATARPAHCLALALTLTPTRPSVGSLLTSLSNGSLLPGGLHATVRALQPADGAAVRRRLEALPRRGLRRGSGGGGRGGSLQRLSPTAPSNGFL